MSASVPALAFDADYQQAIAPFAGMVPPVPTDAASLRATNDATVAALLSQLPSLDDKVKETTMTCTSADGTPLKLHRFTPTSAASSSAPAVLYVFGGGLASGSVALWRKDIMQYAASTGISFFAPAYRLSPEAEFPKPLEDVYAGLEYLRDHAAELGIDASRIAIMGVSAGGGLAAAAALKARDEGFSPPLARQVLIYPMLDDRTKVADSEPVSKFMTWTNNHNEIGWKAYLGSRHGGEVPAYAAPARAEDLSKLPRTYIDVGSLDLFKEEDEAYSKRLAAAGVDVEFHLYPGVPHGWEWAAGHIPLSKKAMQNRVSAFKGL